MVNSTYAWFEFLLTPEILESHLQQKNPEPSALSLILQFIFNGLKKYETIGIRPGLSDLSTTKNVNEAKKKFLMGIIPLKLASFLNWDLDLFSQELPLLIQHALLMLLLEQTLSPEISNPSTHSSLDTGPLLPHQLYSMSLYHRWALQALVRSKLPLKPPKVSTVPIPGQQDPMQETREVQENILSMLKRDVENSVRILEQLLMSGEVRSLTMQAFAVELPKEDKEKHPWHLCKLIPDEQFKCQLHYDLGYYHIMQEKMAEAFHHFSEAMSLYKEVGTNPEFCFFEKCKLEAFHQACASICGRATPVVERSLYDRFSHALAHDLEGIIDTLSEDNLKNEIPQCMRTCFQLNLTTNDRAPEELLLQVQTLNVIRSVIWGEIWDSNYIATLQQAGKQGAQYLIQALVSSLPQLTSEQRSRTLTFLRCLCSAEGLAEHLMPPLMTCAPLLALFDHEEIVRLWKGSKDKVDSEAQSLTNVIPGDKSNYNDLVLTLVHSYDPAVIKEHFYAYINLQTVPHGIVKNPVLDIKISWAANLPEKLVNIVRANFQDPERSLMIIFLAKSVESVFVKNYDAACVLCEEALKISSSASERSRSLAHTFINWMILVCKIQHQIHNLPCVDETEIRNLATQSRACLAAGNERCREGLGPWPEALYWCRILLLNARDWLNAASPIHPALHTPYMQLIKPHAIAAKALHEKSPQKKSFVELFEIVVAMFLRATNSQPNHDHPLTLDVYKNFLPSVKEPNCLSVIVSLLGHIFNLMVEEPTSRVHIEHASIWPTKTLNIQNCFRVVGDVLRVAVDHATKVYPLGSNVSANVSDSWFITKGDLAFFKEKYHEAIQHYLTAIFVATDYLSNDTTLPEQNAMHELLLRRMIRSSKKLGAFTQATILCQFLNPIDYNTALRCLQERNSIDAMDAYYDCLWDVTLMEFIINMHQKRGEFARRDKVIEIIGLLELNSNNNEEIQREAAKVRKHRFLRAMGKQYL